MTYNKLTYNKKSFLNIYGKNLTLNENYIKYNNLYGREIEIEKILKILLKKQKNNPILIGSSNIGKKSIINLISKKIIEKTIPYFFDNLTIIEINLNKFISDYPLNISLDLKLYFLKKEFFNIKNIILFFSDIDNIIENEFFIKFKQFLISNNINFIFSITNNKYEILKKDEIFNSNIEPIFISELSLVDTYKIIKNNKFILEKYHNIIISKKIIKNSINLSSKYLINDYFPNKVINLLDKTSAEIYFNFIKNNKKNNILEIFNLILIKIKKLKELSFLNNDFNSQFVFNEIENIFNNFYKFWFKNNFKYNINNNFLNYFTNLLKISNNINKNIIYINNISIKKNTLILKNIVNDLKNNNKIKSNLYRIILLIYYLNKKNNIINFKFINKIININNNFINKYLFLFKKNNLFFNSDLEIKLIKNNNKINLNNINKIKIKIFFNFLSNLKLILNENIIDNYFKLIKLSLFEKEIIKLFLGYFKKNNILLNFIKNNILITNKNIKITNTNLINTLSNLTNNQIEISNSDDINNLLNLDIKLNEKVIGQYDAIEAITKAVQRSKLGIRDIKKPIASFLFCGPTGVGKTEITKALSLFLFGSENDMIRLDMSEFMEKHSISRLIGSPAGYIGYEEGGQLTELVRKKPYSIILFDEIEKAHKDIFNLLLQILDDGRLTDSKKNLILFNKTIIILTSNIGSLNIQNIVKTYKFLNDNISNNLQKNNFIYNIKNNKINFLNYNINKNFLIDLQKNLNNKIKKLNINLKILKNIKNLKIKMNLELKESILKNLQLFFVPEFLNRLDDIIIFKPLTFDNLLKICDILLNQLTLRIKKEKNISIFIENDVKIKLTKEGYNPNFGARPLKRVIIKRIESGISDYILKNSGKKINFISIKLDKNNNITIN
jgi:ATP-dependent Clp protease ATP-binding subunit ClpA